MCHELPHSLLILASLSGAEGTTVAPIRDRSMITRHVERCFLLCGVVGFLGAGRYIQQIGVELKGRERDFAGLCVLSQVLGRLAVVSGAWSYTILL